MKTLLLLLPPLLLAHTGRAQLGVYAVRGEVLVQARPQPLPLRPGSSVLPGQTLHLPPGAQVVLFDQAGHNIAYTTPGRVSYAALQQAFAASAAGPGRTYLAYVWQQLHHHAAAPAQQGMAPRGGVARGGIPLLAPADSAVVSGSALAFAWQPARPDQPAWLTLYENGQPLLQVRLTSASLTLTPALSRLLPGRVYTWSVAETPEAAAAAPRRAFVLADAAARAAFAQELAGLPAPAAEVAAWQTGFERRWFFGPAAGGAGR